MEDFGAHLYAPDESFENPAYGGDLRASDDRQTVVSPGDDFSVGDRLVTDRPGVVQAKALREH